MSIWITKSKKVTRESIKMTFCHFYAFSCTTKGYNVVIVFKFLIFCFCFVVAVPDLVHGVETTHGICLLIIASENIF